MFDEPEKAEGTPEVPSEDSIKEKEKAV